MLYKGGIFNKWALWKDFFTAPLKDWTFWSSSDEWSSPVITDADYCFICWIIMKWTGYSYECRFTSKSAGQDRRDHHDVPIPWGHISFDHGNKETPGEYIAINGSKKIPFDKKYVLSLKNENITLAKNYLKQHLKGWKKNIIEDNRVDHKKMQTQDEIDLDELFDGLDL